GLFGLPLLEIRPSGSIITRRPAEFWSLSPSVRVRGLVFRIPCVQAIRPGQYPFASHQCDPVPDFSFLLFDHSICTALANSKFSD
ncbi:MAG: hypothetical protein FWH27_10605, partial [Planctomycetaceae bacterium]|nr:hypothetical protein [Planctomycetaceae bacterium]